MIEAVFLCDATWRINRIRQCSEELSLQEGDFLTDFILDREVLQEHSEVHYARMLTFKKNERRIPAVIDSFKEGNLVILAQIENSAEFTEFQNAYSGHLEWAKNHLLGLYHNEYFLIQQMNNKLVDAQRKLTRSNRQLEYALKENKAINVQLEEARLLAERANQSKTRFLANMSHDIRTPMNAIVGLTELMQHHLDDQEALEQYIPKLQSSGHYLLDLINDILDLSKIENGSMELRIEPMDMGRQIDQVVTIIRSQMNKKKQHFSVDNACTECGLLLGDPVRFRQILMNLLSNAVKYTPEGGDIRFTVRETERNARGRRYQLAIEDSGIGMTPEFIRHIFEPFARAESTVGEIQGTGLGMAITKRIIDAMGGSIRVESTPGKGSCFLVELFFACCADTAVPDAAARKQALTVSVDGGRADYTKEVPDAESLCGMRFLCAEDNELNAEILTSMLELEGAACTVYQNGRLLADAFETVRPGEYDAILMDVQMPVMDGYEATRQIRNSRNLLGGRIPIIAMTANAFAEDARRCLEAGMNAHIAKPVEMTILKRTMAGLKSSSNQAQSISGRADRE